MTGRIIQSDEKEVINSVPTDLSQLVASWLSQDGNKQTRLEILNLCKAKDWLELHKRLDTRILFGTAGLRSRMEAGFSRMNTLVVLQATQGLAQHIKKQFPDALTAVVGHDHRFNSQEFALATVATFLQAGFKVIFLNDGDKFVHTPIVPFTVNEVGASVGVMSTASHNPKMDNGYKVYYSNGCQIIPPHDSEIAQSIEENLTLWPKAWKWDELLKEGLDTKCLVYAGEEMIERYTKKMGQSLVDRTTISAEKEGKPWFVYTPIHGVGYDIFRQIAEETMNLINGRDYLCVKEQQLPDPSFPTVPFPNPEEKGALDMAISVADKNGISLVLANDPDADRFSAAVKDNKTGTWRQLTGNEIGALFAFYEFQKYQKKNEEYKEKHPLAMLNSTVSSQLIMKMAEIEQFHYIDTLTGFKWIGNRTLDLEAMNYYVPFGFEEAIGYMFPVMEHDKDGISAASVFLQMYRKWLVGSKKTLLTVLEDIFEKYGVFKEYNGYYSVNDPKVIKEVFDFIRNDYSETHDPYPSRIGEELKVNKFRDLTLGYQSDTVNQRPDLPVDPNSQMITAWTKVNGAKPYESVRFTIRGSGTEPKLKVYIEACSKSEERASELAQLTWRVLKREWFRPDVTGLTTTF